MVNSQGGHGGRIWSTWFAVLFNDRVNSTSRMGLSQPVATGPVSLVSHPSWSAVHVNLVNLPSLVSPVSHPGQRCMSRIPVDLKLRSITTSHRTQLSRPVVSLRVAIILPYFQLNCAQVKWAAGRVAVGAVCLAASLSFTLGCMNSNNISTNLYSLLVCLLFPFFVCLLFSRLPKQDGLPAFLCPAAHKHRFLFCFDLTADTTYILVN